MVPRQLAGQLILELLVAVLQVAQHHHGIPASAPKFALGGTLLIAAPPWPLLLLRARSSPLSVAHKAGSLTRGLATAHPPLPLAEHVQHVQRVLPHISSLVHHLVQDEGQHDMGCDVHARLCGIHLTNDLEKAGCHDPVGVIALVEASGEHVQVRVQEVVQRHARDILPLWPRHLAMSIGRCIPCAGGGQCGPSSASALVLGE
mmetsp:Transcript_27440/g.70694  ORF Transcript_27440/g.70694 Transcript_27440/m.70694 type:complete len:203 (-) Transcript_27440:670-1278(-)